MLFFRDFTLTPTGNENVDRWWQMNTLKINMNENKKQKGINMSIERIK